MNSMIFLKTENISLPTHFFPSTKSPPFHSEERLANLERGRECFDGLSILCYAPVIDKLYTQIGNVNRLHNKIEPFAALF